jgi:C-5 cytosine-specific DNA methylase
MMQVGSLFAGIGGFDEGLRQAGMHSVWQVEKEPFCLKVLKTRFPNAQRAEDILTCRGLISSVPASHARIGRSRDRERDCAASVARSFTSLRESCTSFDPLGSSSRMFPDFSVVTTDETLRKSSGFSWSSAGMGFNGVCLTASFSESPSAAAVCSLSDVLESHAPQRFFLSAKAASGILRRAKKRGRTLPFRLQAALESLATRRGEDERMISTSLQLSERVALDSNGQPETGTSRNSASPNQSTEVGPRADRERAITRSESSQPPLAPAPDITDTAVLAGMAQTTSYWDDTQQTDTLDCSMLAKGQMMPEKRRFPAVLIQTSPSQSPAPIGKSDRDTTQPTASRTCAEERETKLIQGKGLESGKPDPCTPSARQNSTPQPLPESPDQSSLTKRVESGSTPKNAPMDSSLMAVRRLTPTECEILQGFPKGWTLPGTELLETPLPSPSFDGLDGELCDTEASA